MIFRFGAYCVWGRWTAANQHRRAGRTSDGRRTRLPAQEFRPRIVSRNQLFESVTSRRLR